MIRPKQYKLFDDRPLPGGLRSVGLFAGIGGIELGLHAAGHATTTLCEFDPSAAAVLSSRFPSARLRADVRHFDRLPPGTQLLAGGFPCQDLSQAGRGAGIRGKRSGLVGEVFRLLDDRPVKWVLLENVPFMLQLDRGEAMRHLVAEFESRGFNWAYRVVDTRAFGIPQRRQRVIFLASRSRDPRRILLADEAGPPVEPATASSYGFYWTEGNRGLGLALDAIPTLKGGSTIGIPSPPAIMFDDGRVVTPEIRDAERLQGFEPDWTAPACEVGRASMRWKLVGNAVSVPLFEWVGSRLANPGEPITDRNLISKIDGRWPKAGFGRPNGERWAIDLSAYPRRVLTPSIRDFLKYEPKPLSYKAASGFFNRLRASTLRTPVGFMDCLERYVRNAKVA